MGNCHKEWQVSANERIITRITAEDILWTVTLILVVVGSLGKRFVACRVPSFSSWNTCLKHVEYCPLFETDAATLFVGWQSDNGAVEDARRA